MRRRIQLELPEFPPENLLVELGSYGAFDVRIGNITPPLCETSTGVLYPNISNIVYQLAQTIHFNLWHQRQQMVQQRRIQEGNVTPDSSTSSSSSQKASDTESQLSSPSSSSSMSSLDFRGEHQEDRRSVLSPDCGLVINDDHLGDFPGTTVGGLDSVDDND